MTTAIQSEVINGQEMELVNSRVKQFGDYIERGLDYIKNACEIYVEEIDKWVGAKQVFKESYPKVPNDTWSRFEKVGRKQLHIELLCKFSIGARKLARLPFSEQEIAVTKPIEVLTKNNEVLKVDVDKLTKEQSNQVFAENHIRDIAEQKAIIETIKPVVEGKEAEHVTYLIKGNKLIVKEADTIFTKTILKKIIDEMV